MNNIKINSSIFFYKKNNKIYNIKKMKRGEKGIVYSYI